MARLEVTATPRYPTHRVSRPVMSAECSPANQPPSARVALPHSWESFEGRWPLHQVEDGLTGARSESPGVAWRDQSLGDGHRGAIASAGGSRSAPVALTVGSMARTTRAPGQPGSGLTGRASTERG